MITGAKMIGSGIQYDFYSRQPEHVFRGNPAFRMSRSQLVDFAECPAKWLAGGEDDGGTAATTWGSLIDCLALTPDKFDDLYAVAPQTYTTTGMKCPRCESVTDSKTCRKCKEPRVEVKIEKPWDFGADICKEWREKQGGKQCIKSDLREAAFEACDAIRSDDDLSDLIDASERQVMITGEWTDEETGVQIPIRCLIDLVPVSGNSRWRNSLANFKTARNGNPEFWCRVVDENAYDVGAALEMDLFAGATGEQRSEYIFPTQENEPPYHVVKPMMALSVEFLSWGRAKYQSALKLYARCLKENQWPSYSTGNRLVAGSLQFIAPDSLWTYRQKAGEGARMEDYFPAHQPVEAPVKPMEEVIP